MPGSPLDGLSVGLKPLVPSSKAVLDDIIEWNRGRATEEGKVETAIMITDSESDSNRRVLDIYRCSNGPLKVCDVRKDPRPRRRQMSIDSYDRITSLGSLVK